MFGRSACSFRGGKLSIMMKLLILSLLSIGAAHSSYALPPSTFGDAIASAGQLSNKLKQKQYTPFTAMATNTDRLPASTVLCGLQS
ncbi:hypothetical protein pipiens_004389 [Culex pipiens pipiens]|uniref:Uncharacterized protein n=1 Tax=Culex pipiens pipiens TaxID=38569 RepID=A0ABD1CJA4_CULPP